MFCGCPGWHGRPDRGRLRRARGRRRHPALQRRLPRRRRCGCRQPRPPRWSSGCAPCSRAAARPSARSSSARWQAGGCRRGRAGARVRSTSTSRGDARGGGPTARLTEAITSGRQVRLTYRRRSATRSPSASSTRSRSWTPRARPTSTPGATSRTTGGCSARPGRRGRGARHRPPRPTPRSRRSTWATALFRPPPTRPGHRAADPAGPLGDRVLPGRGHPRGGGRRARRWTSASATRAGWSGCCSASAPAAEAGAPPGARRARSPPRHRMPSGSTGEAAYG